MATSRGYMLDGAPAAADADGLGYDLVIRQAFSLSNSNDDLVIYAITTPPFNFRVVDSKVLISTAVAGTTVTIRNATGGAGAALSDDFATATTGTKRDTALTATGTVTTAQALAVNRQGGAAATPLIGEVVIMLQRT